MKNLNICIDIDGTITEPYFWLEFTNEYFNMSLTEEQVTEYDIHEVIGVEEKVFLEFYEKYKFEIHSEQKLRENVEGVIKRLNLIHNIYFVTARDTSLSMVTHLYLKNNKINYDELFLLGSHYKVDKAKELNCSIFIEDNYNNALQLSNKGFKVLLLDTNYNRKPLNENIIRVYNWKEIYLIINELFLQSKAM